MPNVYRFNALRKQALKEQKKLSFDKKGPLTESQKKLVAQAEALRLEDVDVAGYLLYSGVDLKGAFAMAYTASGGGLSASASVNPFGLVGLNTGLEVSAGAKLAKQRSVIVLRGPSAVEVAQKSLPVPKPISISSLIGVYWEASAQVGIDLSFGFEAKAGESGSSKGTKGSSKAEGVDWGKFGEKDDEADKGTGYEMVAASFEAKVGFKAEVGYTYDHFYGEDPFVLPCKDHVETRVSLNQILEEGSTKTAIKRIAVDFINRHSHLFGGKTLSLHKSHLFGAVTTTMGREEVMRVLLTHFKALPETPVDGGPMTVKERAYWLYKWLERYDKAWDGACFLRLSSHQVEGKAGLYAGFEGKAQAMGIVSISASAEAFAGMTGSYKRAYARFQTKSEARAPVSGGKKKADPLTVFTTYDSRITYSSFSLGVELEAGGGLSVPTKTLSAGKTKAGKKVNEGLEKASDAMSKKPNSLNRIHYRCAIAVWSKPKPLAQGEESMVELLDGSGVAAGGSFVVENLGKLYEKLLDDSGKWTQAAEANDYVKIIAKSLGVSAQQVLAFLGDAEVRSLIEESLPDEMGVILEATFAVPAGLKVPVKHGTHPDDENVHLVQLEKGMGALLFQNMEAEAQSIRLRYRKRDLNVRDAALFTVGFKVAGNGFKIKLDKVERAGAEGMVDLRTVFLTNGAPSPGSDDPSARTGLYEAAVPPAALFCQ